MKIFAPVIGSLLLILTACAGPGPQESPPPQAQPDPQPPAQPTAPRRTQADRVSNLLEAAERALAADRLTSPIEDNAYDRYQAVLLLDPDNAQAESGLRSIYSRYVGMIREALEHNDLASAETYLARARDINAGGEALDELQTALVEQRKNQPVAVEPDLPESTEQVPLDPQALSARDEQLVAQLQSLAEKIRANDDSMLIVARNDEEGRWIYRQMAEAVLGYRLRGDMRLGKQPKILLLPPIE